MAKHKFQIIPSIIARSQKELDERLAKIAAVKPTTIHLDIMDGSFLPHTSLEFEFKIPKSYHPEAHLMIGDPHAWFLHNSTKVASILVHYESKVHLHDLIKSAHILKKKIGIAINPETDIEDLTQYMYHIDKIVLMTVHPGSYGAPFLPTSLLKLKHLRAQAPTLDIEVDGGITPEILAQCKAAGANQFVVGSYLQKTHDIKKAWNELNKALSL